MPRQNRNIPVVETEALIHRVDPVNRELGAIVAGALVNVYVPSTCDVVLRGERVKLRMVQPGDRVRVIYTRRGGLLIARHVEVQPEKTPSLTP